MVPKTSLRANVTGSSQLVQSYLLPVTTRSCRRLQIVGAGISSTISGFVVGTYWFLMLIGRLAGASLGAKISSKAMLTFTSALGLLLVFLAIFSSTGSLVNLPVLQQSATGGLSFGFAEVPINAMYLVLVGLCTSIMWGGIFNLAVEGLGKYLAAASGLFMVLVCGGGILPVIQGTHGFYCGSGADIQNA